jgi:hypothetical protein
MLRYVPWLNSRTRPGWGEYDDAEDGRVAEVAARSWSKRDLASRPVV